MLLACIASACSQVQKPPAPAMVPPGTEQPVQGALQPFLKGIAGSGLLMTQHTCTLLKGATIRQTCPKLALRVFPYRLGVPPGARWLFYGTSYLAEVFEAVLAANKDQIASIDNLADPLFAKELHPDVEHKACKQGNLTCNVLAARQNCVNSAFGVSRVTLKNGAVLVGVLNYGLLQVENAAARLGQALKPLKLTHAFYMHPHDFSGSSPHGSVHGNLCMDPIPSQHSDPDEPKLDIKRSDMCTGGYMNDKAESAAHFQCVIESPLWKVVKAAVPNVTLVAPFNVVPGVSELPKQGTHVYYTRYKADYFQCSIAENPSDCPWAGDKGGCSEEEGIVDTVYRSRHQCIVLHDPKRKEYAGGAVLSIAEELFDLVR